MGGREDMILRLRRFREKMERERKIQRMLLFGSAARNEMKKDSDIDIIVVSEDFEGMSPLKRPVRFYVEWDLPYPVDFICYTPKEFERLKHRPSIVREAIESGYSI